MPAAKRVQVMYRGGIVFFIGSLNTIAEVVYQPRQYSWTLEYGLPADNETYRKIMALAKMIIENYEVLKRDDVCMHYTNNDDYGQNHWTKKFKKKTKIGKHWFYC